MTGSCYCSVLGASQLNQPISTNVLSLQTAPTDSTEALRHLKGLSCTWESSASGSLQVTVAVETKRLDILVGTMMLVDKRWFAHDPASFILHAHRAYPPSLMPQLAGPP